MGFTDFVKSLSNIELAGVSLGVGILFYLLYDTMFRKGGMAGMGQSSTSSQTGGSVMSMTPKTFKTAQGITKCQLACTKPVVPDKTYSGKTSTSGCFRLVAC